MKEAGEGEPKKDKIREKKGAFPLSCSFYVLVWVQLTWVNKMEEINFMKGRALT